MTFFCSMYNKTILEFGFLISRIIEVSARVISLSLRLRLITLSSTSIILDITKTSSKNTKTKEKQKPHPITKVIITYLLSGSVKSRETMNDHVNILIGCRDIRILRWSRQECVPRIDDIMENLKSELIQN